MLGISGQRPAAELTYYVAPNVTATQKLRKFELQEAAQGRFDG
jgi:hypothetical protein